MPDASGPCVEYDEDVYIADRIRVGVCSCPTLHIALLDEDGDAIAACAVSRQDWERIRADVDAAFAGVPVDAIGPTEGSA